MKPGDSALRDLRSTMRGQVLLSGDDGYHAARRILNAMIDRRPAIIARCAGAADVVACVGFARAHHLNVSVRGGGHNVPIGTDRAYCYCDVVSPTAEDRLDDLGRLFSGFAEPVPGLLDSVRERQLVHRSTIEEVALASWVRGRVVLVGDAAHAPSPNMAEGAAMGLEDALVLAECLRRFEAIPAALSAFEVRRRSRTDWVRAQTHRRDRTRYLPALLRDALLRAFGRRIFRSNYRPLLDEA